MKITLRIEPYFPIVNPLSLKMELKHGQITPQQCDPPFTISNCAKHKTCSFDIFQVQQNLINLSFAWPQFLALHLDHFARNCIILLANISCQDNVIGFGLPRRQMVMRSAMVLAGIHPFSLRDQWMFWIRAGEVKQTPTPPAGHSGFTEAVHRLSGHLALNWGL